MIEWHAAKTANHRDRRRGPEYLRAQPRSGPSSATSSVPSTFHDGARRAYISAARADRTTPAKARVGQGARRLYHGRSTKYLSGRLNSGTKINEKVWPRSQSSTASMARPALLPASPGLTSADRGVQPVASGLQWLPAEAAPPFPRSVLASSLTTDAALALARQRGRCKVKVWIGSPSARSRRGPLEVTPHQKSNRGCCHRLPEYQRRLRALVHHYKEHDIRKSRFIDDMPHECRRHRSEQSATRDLFREPAVRARVVRFIRIDSSGAEMSARWSATSRYACAGQDVDAERMGAGRMEFIVSRVRPRLTKARPVPPATRSPVDDRDFAYARKRCDATYDLAF